MGCSRAAIAGNLPAREFMQPSISSVEAPPRRPAFLAVSPYSQALGPITATPESPMPLPRRAMPLPQAPSLSHVPSRRVAEAAAGSSAWRRP